ncbi:CocE/NonD family hydrolase [Actinomadura fulvescens]|uniref:CocE/NonD family hydrolase n=1 Tax=Actinomadura fulvescens TaxID=46160 RepID=A0ABP6CIB5_9ACTN
MKRRPLLLLAACALVAGLVAPPAPAAAATTAPTTGFRFFDLTARDGVKLKANVIEPASPGRHPAIVFPASWAANDFEYLLQANKLAARGYVVLSMTPRGLFGSGGEIDVAGPKDLADISAAYDWLIANTRADPGRLGVAGISYGGDMALQMAAYDKRTKAVGGLSAYADLAGSLYPNRTRVSLTVPSLWTVGRVLGRPSAEFTEMMKAFQRVEHEDDPRTQKILAWAGARSASTRVDEINRNGTAVFLANGWGDSFFPPNQFVDFFNRLTVPHKHLEFTPADHATGEATGLAGLPNPVWDSFTRFFDKHLAGRTDVPQDAPVVLTPKVNKPGLQNPFDPGTREPYADWAAIAKRTERFTLSSGEKLDQGTGGPDAQVTIRAGQGTGADSGLHFVTNAIEQFTGIAPTIRTSGIARADGAVWQSSRLAGGRAIRGDVRLRTNVTTTAPINSFFAYLYDVDAGGTGRLITYAPYTLRDVAPGVPLPVDLRLQSTGYDLPSGHRLALVIDTKDFRSMDAGKPGSSLTFSGPSSLDLPVR